MATPQEVAAAKVRVLQLQKQKALAQDGDTEAPPADNLSDWEAAGIGGFQGLTAGWSDELGGAVGASVEGLGHLARGDASIEQLVKDYKSSRDELRTLQHQAEQNHPWSYRGGNLAGGLTLGLATAPLGGPVVTGAALGGIAGAGESEADSLSNVATDAAKGAVLGGAVGVGAKGIGAAAKYGKDAVAPRLAVQALGASGRSAGENIATTAEGRNLGRMLLDNGITQAGSTVEQQAGRIAPLRNAAGQALNRSKQAVDAVGQGADAASLAREMAQAKLVNGKTVLDLLQQRASQSIGANLGGEIMGVGQSGKLSLKQLTDLIDGYNTLNLNHNGPESSALKQGYKNMQGVAREFSERYANSVDPALGADFQAAKDIYGPLAKASDMAESGIGIDVANTMKGANSSEGTISKLTDPFRSIWGSRVNSTLAVGADKIVAPGLKAASKGLRNPAIPQTLVEYLRNNATPEQAASFKQEHETDESVKAQNQRELNGD